MDDITHQTTYGQTKCGKSHWIKLITAMLKRQGMQSIIFDERSPSAGLNVAGWTGHVIKDFDIFNQAVFNSTNCYIVLDEAGDVFDNKYQARDARRMLTQGRHRGHVVNLIAHRAEMLSKSARVQASQLYLFNTDYDDAKNLARIWNCPELENATQLKRGQFFNLQRFHPVRLQRAR